MKITKFYSTGWIKPGEYNRETIDGIEYVTIYKWWEILILRIVKPIQKGLWYIGIAIHDPIFGECTPDFNCCCDCGRKKIFSIGEYYGNHRKS